MAPTRAAITVTAPNAQFYPSFCGLYAHRSEPILVRLLDDPAVYDKVLPGVSEEQRTQTITEVAKTAEREGWQISNGPYFFTDDRL
ncbi:hypothetical protein AB0G20_38140 [Streptomyces sp. NPDC024017]|uniref:hypothetical protein n=1 Tax=Streptomyces sp. NPDC024017 TaxID=3154326 RepID=UPI0033F30D74